MVNEEKAIVEQPHSTKIAVNAKGMWSGEVKVYSETIDEAFSKAVIKVKELSILIAEQNNKGA